MIIPPIDRHISDGFPSSRGTTYVQQTHALKVIVTDMARSGARVFQTPADVSRNDTDGMTPWYGNTSIRSTRLNSPVLLGGGTTVSSTRTEIQEIIIPKGPTGSVEFTNAQPFHASIHGNSAENGVPTPTFSKVIGRELSENSSADI